MIKMKAPEQSVRPINKCQDRLIKTVVFKILAFQNRLCSLLEQKASTLSTQEQKRRFFMFCFAAFPLSLYLVITGLGAHDMYNTYRESIKAPALLNGNWTDKTTTNSSPHINQGKISNVYIDSLIKRRISSAIYDSLKSDHSGNKK